MSTRAFRLAISPVRSVLLTLATNSSAGRTWAGELTSRKECDLRGIIAGLQRTADDHRAIEDDNAVLARTIEEAHSQIGA